MDTGGALGPSLPLGKEESIMGSYIPNTRAQQEAMLAALGVDRVEDLFAAVPREMLVDRLDLPEGQRAGGPPAGHRHGRQKQNL